MGRTMKKGFTPPLALGLVLLSLPLALGGAAGCRGSSSEEPKVQQAAVKAPAQAAEEIDPERAARRALVSTGDLDEIRARGFLRVLVFGDEQDFLAREGSPDGLDRRRARWFSRRLGVDLELIRVDRFEELIPMLLEGKGDLVAARMTRTSAREEKVAFTRPTHVVSEVLVGKKGASNPKSLEELAGRTVHVRPSSSYAETLAELTEKVPTLKVAAADERLDDEQLVHRVGRGELPLTVVDSDVLDAVLTYNEDVEELFALREGRQIAWAVRPSNPELKKQADAFLLEAALSGHRRGRFTGDLDGIKERGVLRVLTRNNGVTYFLYKGAPQGFEYTLAQGIADALGVRLEMVVPPRDDMLIPWLNNGRGDMIAASWTITDDRAAEVAFTEPYLWVNEVLVQRRGGPPLSSPADLAGKTVHVRKSSSYARTLEELQRQGINVTIAEAPPDFETEQIIAKVAEGAYDYTVADEHLLGVELRHRDDIEAALVLTQAPEGAVDVLGKPREGAKGIAFAVRKDSRALKEWLDQHVRKTYRGVEYNMARQRYFANTRAIRAVQEERARAPGKLSPYDELLRDVAARYDLDWRLLAAQAYQESRFDPKAKSWVGARGLFQIMPATGAELGFHNLEDPRQSAEAGSKYLAQLMARFDEDMRLEERVRFALASYNAGYGHVLDARRLAEELGLDRDKWFDNVERAMLLLAQREYARKARHGYCRGEEPVRYVREIQARYDTYARLTR